MPPQLTSRPRGTHLTRVGRYSSARQIYHVTTATRNRQAHFSDVYRGRCVVRAMQRQHAESLATTLAFVVMPDHFHWLMQLHRSRELPNCIGNVKSYSARLFNALVGREGPVWQRGFFDCAVRRECDLIALSRYIVANPLRAGLVEEIGDYPLWDAVWLNQSRSEERSNRRS